MRLNIDIKKIILIIIKLLAIYMLLFIIDLLWDIKNGGIKYTIQILNKDYIISSFIDTTKYTIPSCIVVILYFLKK